MALSADIEAAAVAGDAAGRTLRVAQVMPDLGWGGVQELVASFAERSRAHGIETLVVSLGAASPAPYAARLAAAGTPVVCLGARRALRPAVFLRLVRALAAARVDLVHAHLPAANTLAPVAGALIGAPVLCGLHLAEPPAAGRAALRARLEAFAIRRSARAAVACGPQTARCNTARLGRTPDRLRMHLDFVLMRPTSRPEAIEAAIRYALDRDMQIYVNLVHYSLPYFVRKGEKAEADLSFDERDRALLEEAVEVLLEARRRHPGLVRNSERGIRSIPDWLVLKDAMRVPCTEYEMIWVGPDGTVQMCYVDFPLGNLHERRLGSMLGTAQHAAAARNAYKLDCPNCHCSYDKRVLRSWSARRRYAGAVA